MIDIFTFILFLHLKRTVWWSQWKAHSKAHPILSIYFDPDRAVTFIWKIHVGLTCKYGLERP